MKAELFGLNHQHIAQADRQETATGAAASADSSIFQAIYGGKSSVLSAAGNMSNVLRPTDQVFEFIEITTTTFRERELSPSPVPGRIRVEWHASGIHHVAPNPQDSTPWIAPLDGAHWNS